MRKTRRTGVKLPATAAAVLALLTCSGALNARHSASGGQPCPEPAGNRSLNGFSGEVARAGQKKGEKPHALIAGTVFRDNGMALPGAEVVVEPTPGAPKEVRKIKKVKILTDPRGEFAIRVPPVQASYRLSVSASGFQTQEKSVTIAGEDRIDVFVRLEPASK